MDGRTRLGGLILLILLGGLVGCTPPVPTATLRPVASPTPQLFATVVVTRLSATNLPTWTLPPTFSPRPTSTRLPTNTPIPSRTPRPSASPVGGEPGMISKDGRLTVAWTLDSLNAALAMELRETWYTGEINVEPKARLSKESLLLEVNFNDFTTSGISAEFEFKPRILSGQLYLVVQKVRTTTGGGLTTARVELGTEMLRRALMMRVVPAAIRRFEKDIATFDTLGVTLTETGGTFTVQITGTATGTPTGTLTETPTPSATPTP